VRLPWLAHDEAPGPYITIPQYCFNKTKKHKQRKPSEIATECKGTVLLWASLGPGPNPRWKKATHSEGWYKFLKGVLSVGAR